MNQRDLLRLLEAVAGGQIAPETVLTRFAQWPSEPVALNGEPAWARLDHQRALRTGLPEVVFAPGKTIPQVLEICRRLAIAHSGFLVTRADPDLRSALSEAFPDAQSYDLARIVHQRSAGSESDAGPSIAVVSAGTADLPVAEEAAITAEAFGHRIERVYDVGVAGLHRILEHAGTLRAAGVVIVVAGMEGALPSVVGGMIGAPVIAVPTSIGYGAAFGGIAALLAMLNSCASGVTVVNIDNGFGAACAASRILRTLSVRAG